MAGKSACWAWAKLLSALLYCARRSGVLAAMRMRGGSVAAAAERWDASGLEGSECESCGCALLDGEGSLLV